MGCDWHPNPAMAGFSLNLPRPCGHLVAGEEFLREAVWPGDLPGGPGFCCGTFAWYAFKGPRCRLPDAPGHHSGPGPARNRWEGRYSWKSPVSLAMSPLKAPFHVDSKDKYREPERPTFCRPTRAALGTHVDLPRRPGRQLLSSAGFRDHRDDELVINLDVGTSSDSRHFGNRRRADDSDQGLERRAGAVAKVFFPERSRQFQACSSMGPPARRVTQDCRWRAARRRGRPPEESSLHNP